uniref:Kinesin-like protein n=1 Tax=Albugo laibachii Nc14 TaxID=890382 RepID=F0VZV3_9STRA|nr:kinesinlike protein putative [Albugo laibachii Nc14]|eukprot:CCA14324.1 kinesinlike protein putative [Albugo laibachii Nc14]
MGRFGDSAASFRLDILCMERTRRQDYDQSRDSSRYREADGETDRIKDTRVHHEYADRQKRREYRRDREYSDESSDSGREPRRHYIRTSNYRRERHDKDYHRSSRRWSGDSEQEYSDAEYSSGSARSSTTSSSFRRPATYDPHLARRELKSKTTYGNGRRKSQLKHELGLSDEDEHSSDAEGSSDDHGDTRKPSRVVPTTADQESINELRVAYETAVQELEKARLDEQKAQDSLCNLTLLSKSQAAILKAAMAKRLQEKDSLLEDVLTAVNEHELKLRSAGVDYIPYSPPPSTGLAASRNDVDGSGDSPSQDKIEGSGVGNPLVAVQPIESASSLDSIKHQQLETEIDRLREELAHAHKLLHDNTQTDNSRLGNTAPATNFESELMPKLEKAEASLRNALAENTTLKQELEHLQTSRVAPPITDVNRVTNSVEPSSHLETKILEAERELESVRKEFSNAKKEMQSREASLEERTSKLKALAENELGKIKHQAKKAILDLKQKLDMCTKANQQSRHALSRIVPFVRSQKAEIRLLQAQMQELHLQGPQLAKHLSESILKRVQKQADAMSGVVESYQRELKERKRLFNLVQELKGNIRVLCRVRPMSKSEVANGCKLACKFVPGNSKEITLSGERGKMKAWEFDHVFDASSTQEEIFTEIKPLVTSILDGYNVCIFAYGQTGSGKTHTMAGSIESPGVNTRSLQELFEKKLERAKQFQDDITVSVMEIYNEQIRDLLIQDGSSSTLQVRQGPNGNFVPGLTQVPVQTLDEVLDLIRIGNKFRSTHATDMNEHSSRSHSILSVQLRSQNLVTNAVSHGKVFLVDLAGSERLSKTGAEGLRLKEAQNINRSLSALGDVIAARANKQKHVPYRNSSLTYLLQDALGGDSKTLMVACASPVDYNSEESFCTLNFASRTRTVEMGKATRNLAQNPGRDT